MIRFWTAFKIAFLYITKTVFPINLSASYDYNQLTLVHNPFMSWQALAGMVLLALLVVSVLYKRTAASPIGIGAMIFLISYFVFSKFTVVGGQIMGERWMYLASLGICLMMAYALEKLYRRNRVFAIVCLVLTLSTYSAVIIRRNPVWANEMTIYESMAKTAPNSIQGHKALALAYLGEGDYEKAIPHVEASMRIYIGYEPITSMLQVLASYYSENQKSGKGIVVRGTGETNSLLLAMANAREGKPRQSLELVNSLVADKPERKESPIVLFTYALDYYQLGDMETLEQYLPWVPGESREAKLKNLAAF